MCAPHTAKQEMIVTASRTLLGGVASKSQSLLMLKMDAISNLTVFTIQSQVLILTF